MCRMSKVFSSLLTIYRYKLSPIYNLVGFLSVIVIFDQLTYYSLSGKLLQIRNPLSSLPKQKLVHSNRNFFFQHFGWFFFLFCLKFLFSFLFFDSVSDVHHRTITPTDHNCWRERGGLEQEFPRSFGFHHFFKCANGPYSRLRS